MAFNLASRFPPKEPYNRLLDPGSYQTEVKAQKGSKYVPFLSNSKRVTMPGNKLWTHQIYNTNYPPRVIDITSMKSKRPRFPYEAFSKEDLEELLCRCGLPCICPYDEEQPEEIICQGKIPRRLFKGRTPRSPLGDEGLSSPGKTDHGFEVSPNGTKKRLKEILPDESPPFYNANVNEFTSFYHGWKWSQWTSKREPKSLEKRPGPADYMLERKPTEWEECVEKLRQKRRKTSKQLRFIELIQQRNILEGRPGPATYSPKEPRGTDLQFLGPKCERFPSPKYATQPGPADHWIKRSFDPPEIPEVLCHARLPESSFFGIKAKRFKPQREEGPSPASYAPDYKPYKFMHCPTAAFSSSAKRFKDSPIEEHDEEFAEIGKEPVVNESDDSKQCARPTWGFKSKTMRIKPLKKELHEPSPADLPQSRIKVKREPRLQYYAPFFTSEGRFQPWYNDIGVYGKEKTPGPAVYCLEKPKCFPAVSWGPLFRAPRFPDSTNISPAPNAYTVGDGVESILATHNRKLKNNIENQPKFKWEPPPEPRLLSFDEQLMALIHKSIALLEVETELEQEKDAPILDLNTKANKALLQIQKEKPKLLRCFLHKHQVPLSL